MYRKIHECFKENTEIRRNRAQLIVEAEKRSRKQGKNEPVPDMRNKTVRRREKR